MFINTNQSLVYLNPSFAGSNGFLRHQISFRNQWPDYINSYDGASYNYGVCTDIYLKGIKGGFALATKKDFNYGYIVDDRIDATYAQHISLLNGKLKISPSIQISYLQRKTDYAKIYQWYNPNPYINTKPTIKQNIDISSGLIINYKRFYFGATLFNINQPELGGPFYTNSTYKLPLRLSFFSSINTSIGSKSILNLLIRYERQSTYYKSLYYYINGQFAVNLVLFNHLILGYGFKSSGASNFFSNSQQSLYSTLGYRHNYFALTFNYEGNISSYNGFQSANQYELTASFNLRKKEERKLLLDFEKW